MKITELGKVAGMNVCLLEVQGDPAFHDKRALWFDAPEHMPNDRQRIAMWNAASIHSRWDLRARYDALPLEQREALDAMMALMNVDYIWIGKLS